MGEYTAGLKKNFENLQKVKDAEDHLRHVKPEVLKSSNLVEFMRNHIRERDTMFGLKNPSPNELVKPGKT